MGFPFPGVVIQGRPHGKEKSMKQFTRVWALVVVIALLPACG